MTYVPVGERVRATSVYIALSALGAAAAPLVMAPTMEQFRMARGLRAERQPGAWPRRCSGWC